MATDTNTVEAIYRIRDEMSDKLDRISNKMKGLTGGAEKVKTSIGNIAMGAGAFELVSRGFQALSANVGSAVQRFDQLNNFPKVLKQMGASTKESTASIKKMSSAIDGLPTSLNDIAMTTQRLFPILHNDLDKATSSSISLNDAFLASGASAADASRGMEQYTQMLSAGKVDMQSWKTLEETMPYGLQKIAHSFNVANDSSRGLYEKLKSGEITMDEFNNRLIKLDGGVNGFAKVARTATGGIGTAFQNLKNRTVKGLTDIIEALDKATVSITGASIAAHVSDIGNTIKNVLSDVGTFIGNTAQKLKPYFDVLSSSLSEMAKAVSSAFSEIAGQLSVMNNQVSNGNTGLNTFKSIMGAVTSAIKTASQFTKEHAEAIATIIKQLPLLVAGYMAFTKVTSIVQSTTKAMDVLSPKIQNIQNVLQATNAKVGTFLLQGVENIKLFTGNLNNIKTSSAFLRQSGVPFFTALNQSITEFVPKGGHVTSVLAGIESAVANTKGKILNSIAALKSAMASFSAFTTLAFTNPKAALQLFVSAVKTGFTAIKTQIVSLTMTMLANPITAILVAISVAVAGLAVAWTKNIGHIREYTQGAFSAIGSVLSRIGSLFQPMLDSLGLSSDSFKALFDLLGNIGKGVFAGFLVTIGLVVDAFRAMAAGIATVIISISALLQAITKSASAIKDFFTGNWKAAKEEAGSAIGSIQKGVEDIGKTWETFGKDSATGAVISSFDKTDKKIKETEGNSKALKKEFESLANQGKQTGDSLSKSFDESKQAISSAFTTDRMQEFTKSSSDIMDRFVKTNKSAFDKLDQASKESGNKRIMLTNEAMSEILNAETKGADGVLSIMKDNSQMLKDNKDQEGNTLTESQRKALEDQNQVIRDGLMKQEKLYLEAAQAKIDAGQKLSKSEETAVIDNINGLYRHQSETVTANEQRISELKQKISQARTNTEKADFQEQLSTLTAGNNKLIEQQSESGVQMLALLKQQGNLKETTVASSLKSMGATTATQLDGIYQQYVSNGASISEQLTLLGGIMRSKGYTASNELLKALKSGDYSSIGQSKAKEVADSLSVLPPSLFKKGSDGQKQLVKGLRDGSINVKDAGKYLSDLADNALNTKSKKGKNPGTKKTDDMASGISKGGSKVKGAADKVNKQASDALSKKGNAQKSGASLGNAYSTGLESTKGKAKSAGTSVNSSASKGAGEKTKMSKSGKSVGNEFADSLKKTKSKAKDAGDTLGYNGAQGAKGRHKDFVDIGKYLGEGLAKGMNDSLDAVTKAADKLAEQAERAVRAKAKINSPSRVFKELGSFIGQGLALGIDGEQNRVKQSMNNMINGITQQTTQANSVVSSDVKMSVDHSNSGLMQAANMIVDAIAKGHVITLDTGTMVGELSPGINHNLGDFANLNDRRAW